MGRHPIGFEVQKVLAAVDRFRARRGETAKIGVVGYAEGGLIAFYAAAIDTRIDGALVSGYFDRRGACGKSRSIATSGACSNGSAMPRSPRSSCRAIW